MSYHRRQLVSALARTTRYAAFGLLCLTGLSSVATAQTPRCSVTLAWDEHPDAIANFEVDYGTAVGTYTSLLRVPGTYLSDNGITVKQTRATVSIVQPTASRSFYFALRALDAANVSSGRSNEVSVLLLNTCGGTAVTPTKVPQSLTGAASVRIVEG